MHDYVRYGSLAERKSVVVKQHAPDGWGRVQTLMFPWMLMQQPQHPQLAGCRSVNNLRDGVRAIHPGPETLGPAGGELPASGWHIAAWVHMSYPERISCWHCIWEQRTTPTRYYSKGKHYPGSHISRRRPRPLQICGGDPLVSWWKTLRMINVVLISPTHFGSLMPLLIFFSLFPLFYFVLFYLFPILCRLSCIDLLLSMPNLRKSIRYSY
jgi:hypothetical protein